MSKYLFSGKNNIKFSLNRILKIIQAFLMIPLSQGILVQIFFSLLTKAWSLILSNVFMVELVQNVSQGISSNDSIAKHEYN